MNKTQIISDVLCVGLATWDLVFSVPTHPRADEKIFAAGFLECGGGPAANAAVAVARLGGEGAFLGYLGEDLFGQKHYAELKAEGVECEGILRGKHPTRLAVVLVKPSGERTVVSWKGKAPFIPAEADISRVYRQKPKVLLIDGHEPLISAVLAGEARELGIPVVLDAGSLHPGTSLLLEYTDYLVCSRKFARDYCGNTDPSCWLDELGGLSATVVITLGGEGLIWKQGALQGRLDAYPVDVQDTTGAGDTFHGAFALALAEKKELREILSFASAAAALCCSRMGARYGCPGRADVMKLKREAHPGRG